MKVKLDDEVLYEIDDRMYKMISDYVVDPLPDIKRRLKWVIEHLCDQIYLKLERDNLDKLRQDPNITSIPKKKEDLVDLIFSKPGYKNRAQREAEEKL